MNCIRCQKRPAAVRCDCLVFTHVTSSSTSPYTNATTYTQTEYSTGIEPVGLCEACAKKLARRKMHLLYPAMDWLFYVFMIPILISIIVFAMGAGDAHELSLRNVTPSGVAAFYCACAFAALGLVFLIVMAILATVRRSDRDKLLLAYATAGDRNSDKIHVPMCAELYPNYKRFRKINSRIHPDNAKQVYERFFDHSK